MKYTFLHIAWLLTIITGYGQSQPGCQVNPADFEFSMTITAHIEINAEISSDSNDYLYAFVDEECRGYAPVSYIEMADTYSLFLTIYSNVTVGENLYFSMYDASEDSLISCLLSIPFYADENLGTVSQPLLFSNASYITLDHHLIEANQPAGQLVGYLSCTDTTQGITYHLVEGTDDTNNNDFYIENKGLYTNKEFNTNLQQNLSVRIKAINTKNISYFETFSLTVGNTNSVLSINQRSIQVYPNPAHDYVIVKNPDAYNHISLIGVSGIEIAKLQSDDFKSSDGLKQARSPTVTETLFRSFTKLPAG